MGAVQVVVDSPKILHSRQISNPGYVLPVQEIPHPVRNRDAG